MIGKFHFLCTCDFIHLLHACWNTFAFLFIWGRKRRKCIRTAVAEFIRLENYKIAENNCIAINSLEVSNAAVTFFIRAVIILTLFLAKFLSLTDFIIQFWFTVLRHQSNHFPFALSLPTIFGHCHLHCRLNSRHATTFSGAYFNYFLWFCAFLCEHISNITDWKIRQSGCKHFPIKNSMHSTETGMKSTSDESLCMQHASHFSSVWACCRFVWRLDKNCISPHSFKIQQKLNMKLKM